ncbi:hypothetical protein CERSUDRAFT_115744 [Gelatoporia subvermispora B]|uniref:FZ domain-containing protein n=1 Tax=Ceriporiopsis subvermispora (strain B) TaxID=914234 RepID=M2RBL4_CERS8|nr:hypothetical protein CERSUDRAFT_115744 [Gelatoporia subvermispora B]
MFSRATILPPSLLCLIQAYFVLAQQSQLVLNQLQQFSASTLPNPPTFSLPTSANLSISIALCSNQTTNVPRFFVTNDSSIPQPGSNNLGQPNVYEIIPNEFGLGNWSGPVSSGGAFSVSNIGQAAFEIGASNSGPMHQLLDTLPLFGDTTSNQAFVFSPPFLPPSYYTPTYPNYTLPPANLTFPPAPSSPPDYTMYIIPTSPSTLALPRTGCGLTTAASIASNNIITQPQDASQGMWLRDSDGWRWQWLVNGLVPQTNYTAYAVQNEANVSGPIFFVTKSASFSCPIVHSLPFCPSTSWAVPLPAPSDPSQGHTANTLPNSLVDPIIQVLTNFTTMLTTFPCGRDDYSPLVTCADCQAAYRTWLCTVTLPRCGEFPPNSSVATTSASSHSTSATSSALVQQLPAQMPLPALMPQPPTVPPRSPFLSPYPATYDALLPCLETCNAVDRACPPFLGFKCPLPKFTASASYGVGYIDSGNEDEMGGGLTGSAQDRWGNVWCNAG